MERTISKRELLRETTSYEQDLSSSMANPSPPQSQSSTLTKVDASISHHPLEAHPQISGLHTASPQHQPSMQGTMTESFALPPPVTLPTHPPPQYHIASSESGDRRMRDELSLATLPPELTTSTDSNRRLMIHQSHPHNIYSQQQLLQLPMTIQQQQQQQLQQQQQQYVLGYGGRGVLTPSQQFGLATVSETAVMSSNEAGGQMVGVNQMKQHSDGVSSAFTRDRPTASASNGLGSGTYPAYGGGVSDLTGPGTVQQVIGALQASQQQPLQQQHRRVTFSLVNRYTIYLELYSKYTNIYLRRHYIGMFIIHNRVSGLRRAAASFRRSTRSSFGRKKRGSDKGVPGSNGGSPKPPKKPPVGYSVKTSKDDASSEHLDMHKIGGIYSCVIILKL